jgi:hypothetical protein
VAAGLGSANQTGRGRSLPSAFHNRLRPTVSGRHIEQTTREMFGVVSREPNTRLYLNDPISTSQRVGDGSGHG